MLSNLVGETPAACEFLSGGLAFNSLRHCHESRRIHGAVEIVSDYDVVIVNGRGEGGYASGHNQCLELSRVIEKSLIQLLSRVLIRAHNNVFIVEPRAIGLVRRTGHIYGSVISIVTKKAVVTGRVGEGSADVASFVDSECDGLAGSWHRDIMILVALQYESMLDIVCDIVRTDDVSGIVDPRRIRCRAFEVRQLFAASVGVDEPVVVEWDTVVADDHTVVVDADGVGASAGCGAIDSSVLTMAP